ncbi:MAG: EAL domain-containing protein [Burkholderiaceae bacterium]|nr:EAL domain-containing protein [Burkholderiaceae bacterium]
MALSTLFGLSPGRRWQALFRLYDPDDQDAPVYRARQLQAVLRLTPAAMLVNLSNVGLVCMAVWGSAWRGALLAWAAAVLVMAGLGLQGWLSARRRGPREVASRRALRRATWQAGALAAAWAALPLLQWDVLGGPERFFVGVVITGMTCAGGFALATVPTAATAWVAVLGAGASLTLLGDNGPLARATMGMLAAYALLVVFGVWVHARNFSARLVAEARADRHAEVIRLLLRDFEDHASDLLWELDADGAFVHAAPRLAAALAADPAGLHRRRAEPLLRGRVPRHAEARHCWHTLRRLMGAGQAFRDCVITLQGDDGPRWWSLSARPLPGGGWRGVAADVTERQQAQRRLTWLAHNDMLTGLCNRAQFHELLSGLLARPVGQSPAPLTVLMFDLDDFKRVNDSLGHAVGDQLLQTFGERLRSVARRSDVVARLGGDEFAMLVPGALDDDALQQLAARLLEALDQPCRLCDHTLLVRSSIGMARAPMDGDSVDALLQHADVALYAAKHEGGARAVLFHAGLAEAGRRRDLVLQALQGALERGEFRLLYQPQAATVDWQPCGVEALLRWSPAGLGEVSPSEFVPIAEQAGLMPAIGAWVLQQACQTAAAWPAPLRVSVNVSATQLAACGLVETVRAALGSSGLAASRLELEITESALIADANAAIQTLCTLRALGCRTALDDFGTGYSALGYLRRFPFDVLKIDRSFVRGLEGDAEARVLVDTILAMARALQMTTVAEGVEHEAEARLLSERGCSAVQGYWLSRPLPPQELPRFLAQWSAQAKPRSTQTDLQSV